MNLSRKIWIVGASSWLGVAFAQTTHLVSANSQGLAANFGATDPSVSGDGRFVAFYSPSNNLVPGDTNNKGDVFVRDLVSGTTVLASVDSAGVQQNHFAHALAISHNGSRVVFDSLADNLVAGDGNNAWDIFLRDFETATTTRVSVDSLGAESDQHCLRPAISGNGLVVAFTTTSTTLDPNDLNGLADVYLHDTTDGTTTRISVTPAGLDADGNSGEPNFSFDGRFVVFRSAASNLSALDNNGVLDVYRLDRSSNSLVCASVAPTGLSGNGPSARWGSPAVSDDGRFVAFDSEANDLVVGDTNGINDVFVRDMVLGTTVRVNVGDIGQSASTSTFGGLSADGRFVTFENYATDLVSGGSSSTNDVLVRDVWSATTELVSVGIGLAPSNGNCFYSAISADGNVIAFQSEADNLVSAPTNIWMDVFAREWRGNDAFDLFCVATEPRCPCATVGAPWSGCDNSASTGGAKLTATGSTQPDTLTLHLSGVLPNATAIVFQGSSIVPPMPFGDGLRCLFGTVRRLHVAAATGGALSFPGPGEPSISAQSATLGDTIAPGTTRGYQVYYRDGNAAFCSAPQGGTFNASNGIRVTW